MRRVRGGEIADGRQYCVLSSATLGIARRSAGAGLDDAIAIGQSLYGFVGDRGGIRSTLNRSCFGGNCRCYLTRIDGRVAAFLGQNSESDKEHERRSKCQTQN